MYRYVPILRLKAGEKLALKKLSPAARVDVTPLLTVAPEQFVGKKATAKKPAIPSPVLLTAEIQASWGAAPFFLDATQLPSASGAHPLAAIAQCARTLGMPLIPSTGLAVTTSYQNAVASIAATDRRGVALRVDLQEASSASLWVSSWPYPLGETDLVVDLAGSVGVAQSLGAALTPAFSGLHQGSAWRSVTIADSSMPDNFTGLAQGLYTVPRAEWAIWSNLVGAGLPYRLDFGDYATVATVPAPSGIKWGFPISAKYTLASEFLICRGVRTVGPSAQDMDVQLLAHARNISGYPTRSPLGQCWADGEIDKIAAGASKPSGLTHWVALGANRHLERTRATLP